MTLNTIWRRPNVHLLIAGIAALVLWDPGAGRPKAASNPITVENALTGDAGWDIAGAGDATIQGFATDISVNTGQTVDFKIKTDSANYQIEIYRLGYYGGAGARKLTTLGPFTQPQNQTAVCATQTTTTGLVDCGTWAVSASWPSTGAVSGVYVAKLIRNDTGGSSHIVFIVRDDARQADVVVQTSDTTWQAYNQFGGASLYCGGPVSNAGTAYSCSTRATKVSYNRPFDTRAHDPQSFLFNAEFPMIRWLEANGYDVKYWAGVDTDRRGTELTGAHKPKAFFSVGHDEYWSGNQRTMVESARNAGVHLAFFSGNEIYWKTRYEPSIDGSNVAYRTLVTYKETLAGAKIDPAVDGAGQPIWTGTWRDPRFSPPADGGRPENGVSGNIWTVDSGTTTMTIPAAMAHLRFWQNTRVADLTSGVATLSPESLGYEWDEDLDNGARPAGIMHLSSTTVNGVVKIIDYGTTTATGTATHNLTLYRHASGALVFAAGTVQWSWGLDAVHDRGTVPAAHVPDQAMQQSTVNLLADMGAQPGTLQIGADPNRPLVATSASTDILAPTSVVGSPAAGAQVQSGNRVTITGTAADNGGGVVTSVEVSVDGGATWHVAQGTASWSFDWSPGAPGSVVIRSRAVDDSGNLEAAGPGVTVSVVPGSCPCTTIWQPSAVPALANAGDPNAIELGVKFKSDVDGFVIGVRFYKGPTNTGTHQGSLWTLGGTRLATAVFAGESGTGWQQVNFATPVNVTANTTYIASYHTNVGGYSADPGYFVNAGVDSYPLHALPSGTSGGNGVYTYGASVFPTHTFNHTNYWVDVDFAETIIDADPLVNSNIGVSVIDGSTATITWKTNREATSRIDYSIDPALPVGPTTFAKTDGAFVTQHSLTLTGLTPNATYYYRITSVDHSDEAAVSTPPSFTVPGPTLHDTASADFLAGTPGNTYVSQTADGEVILAPTSASEFTGPALPAGWIEVTWSSQGYSVIGNGVLLVDGARVATCVTDTNSVCLPETQTSTPSAIFSSPHSLEFYANFSGDQFQHAGFAQTLGSGSEPWALFGTAAGSQLFTRTNTGGGSVDTPLGSGLLGSFHRFRIDWKATSVDYSVDGALVHSDALTVAGPMRPIAASDFNPFGGIVYVDWMRMTPYAASGTFLSRIFDAVAPVDWHSIQWSAKAPAGTSVAISIRTGNTPTPDGTWSAFGPVTPGPITATSRFIQYQAAMTTSDPNQTPELDDIIISTDHAPVAVNDAAATNVDTSHVFPASGPGSLKFNDSDADATDTLRVTAVTAPAHGTALLNADGSVTYTPAAGFTGDDSFTYTLSDGLLTATATVSMTVGGTTHVNSDPVANPDSATVAEDSVANAINVLANDNSGPDPGETLSVTAVTQGAHGSVTFTAAGVSYTPAANYNGPDSFTYTIGDGNGGSASAPVTVTVTSVNDDPVANNDSATVAEDSVANAINVLANDNTGPDTGETLSVTGVTQGTHGSVTFTGTGVSYTPAANYNGADSFTYTIGDGNGGSATATVSVTVTSVNDAPSFTGGPNRTAPKNGGAQSVPAWATNLSAGPPDEAGQILTFLVSNDNAALFSTPPAIAANGTLTFTPATGVVGVANVTVRLSDNGGTANGGVDTSAPQGFTITVFDPPPVALCQNVTVTASLIGTAAASINAGSFDPDGGSVTLAQVPPGPYTVGQTSVTLNVTDLVSHTTSCSATVTVNPFAPGLAFGFEEASGSTVLDSSGNNNNGSFNPTNGPQRTAAGRFGKGMVFDGIDDLITVADSNSLDLTSAMTLMAWVKVSNQTGWRNILMKQNGNDLAYAMYANNSQSGLGQPVGYTHVGSGTQAAAATESALQGKWMHVAVTFGGGSLQMYVNGVLERTVAVSGNLPVTAGPLWLGGDLVWLDEYFSGVMDEVRILGVTLSVADIRTLMRTPVVPGSAPPPTDPTGLVAAYNFDNGTATDVTGRGHNGVLVNGPVAAPGVYGQALSFNGTNALVSIAAATDFDFKAGMTLEAWVRPNALTGWQTVILKQAPSGLAYGLYASDQAQHAAGFARIGTTDRDVRAPDPLPINAWSHVVVTYDKTGSLLRMWVDGIPRDDRIITGDIVVSTGALFMGGNQFWGEYFNGRIDNVRIYNRPLGIVEIQTNQVTPIP